MQVLGTDAAGDRSAAVREGKYLTFTLAGEDYGIGIRKVKEIIGMMAITRIPQVPSCVKGVINLRGKVIPVSDLRLRFGMEEGQHTEKTCIVVVEVARGESKRAIGIIVDSVSEVVNIRGGEIEDTPDFDSRLDTRFILGLAKLGSGVKILLDIDRVLGGLEPPQGDSPNN
jgi:purine-binding chemotaxis protein CheW